MALADTTFVNLRNSLDALTPLVNASKPVAPKLQEFLTQLRPLAQNAVPTVQNLASIICSRGSKPCSQSVPGQQRPAPAARAERAARQRDLRHERLDEQLQRIAGGRRHAAAGRVPAVDVRAQRLDPRARHRPPVRGRPDRLVRGLSAILAGPTPTASSAASLRSSASARSRTARSTCCPSFLDPVLREVLAFGGSGTATGREHATQGLLTPGQGDRCPGSMERGARLLPRAGLSLRPERESERGTDEAGPHRRRHRARASARSS